MIREIKFRAWHRKERLMGNVICLPIGADSGEDIQVDLGAFVAKPYLTDSPDEFEVMQYTGLKDKNGVEIHEGDVVDCWDNCGFENVSAQLNGRVVFNGGCFCVKDSNGYHNRRALTCAENVEVIGNIYQNPELLS